MSERSDRLAIFAKGSRQECFLGNMGTACFLGNMDREISAKGNQRRSTCFHLSGRPVDRSWETSAAKFWLRAPAGLHKCWLVPSQALCPEPVSGVRSRCSPPSKTRSRLIYPRNQLKTKHRPETAPSRRSIMVEGGTRQSEGNKVVPGPIPATLLRHQPKKARKCTKWHKPNRGGLPLRGLIDRYYWSYRYCRNSCPHAAARPVLVHP
jgi:hypothetical protein